MSESSFEAVQWSYDHEDMPVLIVVNLDGGQFEIRKVEVFRDGQVLGVNHLHCIMGTTVLPDKPWPTLASSVENPDESFVARPMSSAEFENLWHQSEKALETSIPVNALKE